MQKFEKISQFSEVDAVFYRRVEIHPVGRYGLLNKKCLRSLMNRIQSKDHRIGTYEVNKIYLSFFDEKINIYPKQWIDGLAIGY